MHFMVALWSWPKICMVFGKKGVRHTAFSNVKDLVKALLADLILIKFE
jgi:hypothetical protein